MGGAILKESDGVATSFYFVPGDDVNWIGNVTGNWDLTGAGSLDAPVRFFGHGYTLTGNLTVDENYYEFYHLNVTGAVTISANYYKWK